MNVQIIVLPVRLKLTSTKLLTPTITIWCTLTDIYMTFVHVMHSYLFMILPCVIGSDNGPSPIKLVACTVTLILVEEGQSDELVSNM